MGFLAADGVPVEWLVVHFDDFSLVDSPLAVGFFFQGYFQGDLGICDAVIPDDKAVLVKSDKYGDGDYRLGVFFVCLHKGSGDGVANRL